MLNRLALTSCDLALAAAVLWSCGGHPIPMCLADGVAGSESVRCPTGGNPGVGGSTFVESAGGLEEGGDSAVGGTAVTIGGTGDSGETQQTGGSSTGGSSAPDTSASGGVNEGGSNAPDTSASGGLNEAGSGATGGSAVGGDTASNTADPCEVGLADCDGQVSNGCEVNLLSDPANCGTCGHMCAVANGVSMCSAGACKIARCTPGFSDCNDAVDDGCELNVGNAGCITDGTVYTLQVNDTGCHITNCVPFSSNPNPTYACEQGPSTMSVTAFTFPPFDFAGALVQWRFGGFSTPTTVYLYETAQGFEGSARLPPEGSSPGTNIPIPGFTCGASDSGAGSALHVSIDCTGTGAATVWGSAIWDPMTGCPGDCSASITGFGTVSSGGATKAGCSAIGYAGVGAGPQ